MRRPSSKTMLTVIVGVGLVGMLGLNNHPASRDHIDVPTERGPLNQVPNLPSNYPFLSNDVSLSNDVPLANDVQLDDKEPLMKPVSTSTQSLDNAPIPPNKNDRQRLRVIGPAKIPPSEEYLPPGEPMLDDQGEYIPRAQRQDPMSLGRGVDHRGVYEETKKKLLPYPELVRLIDILDRWPPDQPDIPNIPFIRDGTLEVFDYSNITERARADWLRWNEVPFKMINVPVVGDAVQKWSSDEYMIRKFGNVSLKATTSTTNHFRYFQHPKGIEALPGYSAPTGAEKMNFSQYLEHAYQSETLPVESPHYYVQLNAVGYKKWILDDLPVLRANKSFFCADPKGNRGANCRFGSRGIIASSHWDGGRNMIVILRGAKRYVLLPPDQCKYLYLYNRAHPEGRHSRVDWSNFSLSDYPLMAKARATEVVVSAGEVLYVPPYWFHYIVSTGVSFQCNARSGNSYRMRAEVTSDCGDLPKIRRRHP